MPASLYVHAFNQHELFYSKRSKTDSPGSELGEKQNIGGELLFLISLILLNFWWRSSTQIGY